MPLNFLSDGSLKLKENGVGILFEEPSEVLLEQSLYFGFKANGNQKEYEALIARMKLDR